MSVNTRNYTAMHIMPWEKVYHEILGFNSWNHFSKKMSLLVKQYYWYLTFLLKIDYLIELHILQIVFGIITYSIGT